MLQELHLKLLELYGLNAMDHPHGDQWPDRAFLREEPLCVVARVVPSAARAPGGGLARRGLFSALAGVCRISGGWPSPMTSAARQSIGIPVLRVACRTRMPARAGGRENPAITRQREIANRKLCISEGYWTQGWQSRTSAIGLLSA